jgi:hypothetical protein
MGNGSTRHSKTWSYPDDVSPFITGQVYSNAYESLARSRYQLDWVREFVKSVNDKENGVPVDIGDNLLPTYGALIIRDWEWLNKQVNP